MKPVSDPVTGVVTWVDDGPIAAKAAGVMGVDYDPYDAADERAEGFFLGKIFAKVTGETDGFISTYREWHVMVQGAYAGFRAATLGAVPTCPPLWQDEAQYYEGAAMVTNVIKCQWPTIAIALGGLASHVAGLI